MNPIVLKRVVGLFGVSGVGKTRLLGELAAARPEWQICEGSQVIADITKDQGGLEYFKILPEKEKTAIRSTASQAISNSCSGVTLVAGHFSFPTTSHTLTSTGDEVMSFEPVFTPADAQLYGLVVYLDHLPASEIKKQREQDSSRIRPDLSENNIAEWIKFELSTLRRECETCGIRFVTLSSLLQDKYAQYITTATSLEQCIASWLIPMTECLEEQSEKALWRSVDALPRADTYLLIDGDRTLCPEDTTVRFFQGESDGLSGKTFSMLESVFKRKSVYCFEAFMEASLIYASIGQKEYFERALSIGQSVEIYPKWKSFLQNLPRTVHPVVITSGIAEVWSAALRANDLLAADTKGDNAAPLVSLIAGNRMGFHAYLVDDAAKGRVCQQLRNTGAKVIAFGDSLVDVEMLNSADRSYVVLDSKRNRSLNDFIASKTGVPDGCSVYQLQLACDGHDLHTGEIFRNDLF